MTKTSRLEFFEKGYAWKGVEVGSVSISEYMKFIRYKIYLDYAAQGHDKCTAIQLTADQTNASFSTVWRSVEYFS